MKIHVIIGDYKNLLDIQSSNKRVPLARKENEERKNWENFSKIKNILNYNKKEENLNENFCYSIVG